MSDPFAHCEHLLRAADKDRFLATLFAPAQRRGALFALYAFNAEVARIRDAIRDPMAGEVRLQWWRDAIERPGAGEARGNPVAAALLDTIVRFRLPLGSIIGLLEARAFDLYNDPMPTLAALEGYAHNTASTLIDLAARILDGDHGDIASAIRDAGMAYAITGLLRAFPLHASRGQLYVPLEMLERHGARPDDVFAGRLTVELSAALVDMRRLARTHFDSLRASDLPPGIAAAFLPVVLVPIYLAKLERSQSDPFRLIEVPQWRRQWALWREARRL
jgi:15-cis-phytoene synthase